jgi:uncharacterized membrane protein YfhO
MDFTADSRNAGFLVIPNNFYPGWTATVNGKPAPIYRANWVGMAVPVQAGHSSVTLHFTTPGWRLGAWLSSMSIVIWAIGLIRVRSRHNPNSFPGRSSQRPLAL